MFERKFNPKRTMSLLSKVLVLLLIVSAFLFSGFQSISASEPNWSAMVGSLVNSTGDVDTYVVESNDEHTVLRIEVKNFTKKDVAINGETYTRLSCGDKEGIVLKKGEPELPRISRSVVIPYNADVKVNVLSSAYKDYAGCKVVPSKGNLDRFVNPADVTYTFGPVYTMNQWYPANLASVGEPFNIRDYRGAVVDLNAFQYQPVSKTLRVYTSVTLEVVHSSNSRGTMSYKSRSSGKLVTDFDDIYCNSFMNYTTLAANSRIDRADVKEKGDMLIICYDDFYNTMLPFVEWKKQLGINTTIVKTSVAGKTNTAIQTYIKNAYNSNNNLCYVLLVGDNAQVPSLIYGQNTSDVSFGKVVGTDDYCDILIGRFSAESIADVQTQIDRTISYDKDAAAGADWYKKAVIPTSSETQAESSNESERDHCDHLAAEMQASGYIKIDKDYAPSASQSLPASTMSTQLNEGRGIINYCDHGSVTALSCVSFSNSAISTLKNAGKLPFIDAVACLAGQFETGTCNAEAWLRSKDSSGKPIGAIAAYLSSISQPWVPPYIQQHEFTDRLCAKTNSTIAGLCYNGAFKMLAVGNSESKDTYYHWNFFGDPSLVGRTDSPSVMTVMHPGGIAATAASYTVNVSGVSGALCALYANGTLYGSAYTGSDGKAVISIKNTLPSSGTLTLTVSGLNKVLNISSVTVGGGETDTPTPTPTPTSTPSPVTYQISGFIKPDFAYTDTNLNAGFKIEIVELGKSATTNTEGHYEITGLSASAADYTIKITKPNYLTRTISGINISSSIILGTLERPLDMWAGDILRSGVQDDVINMSDIVEVSKGFNAVQGDAKYISDYDVNKDAAINMADMMIIVKHFNKTAADYPQVVIVVPTALPTYTPTATPTATPTTTPTTKPTLTPTATPTSNTGYPDWNSNAYNYAPGDKVSYQNSNYECIQAHTSNTAWDPLSTLNILWKLM